MKIITIIPTRLAATRLPNKPLADIHGRPMIWHCYERARDADIGDVIVAAGDQDIYDTIHDYGGHAILTDPVLPSGTDRAAAALQSYDSDGKYTHIINLQGDLPFIKASTVHACGDIFRLTPHADMTTLASIITENDNYYNPNFVKAICGLDMYHQKKHQLETLQHARALYFTRATAPYIHPDNPDDNILLEHIGIYGYSRAALQRFVKLPVSYLEKREKLEQLRALEAGFHIEIGLVKDNPLAIDTQEDLVKARMQTQ